LDHDKLKIYLPPIVVFAVTFAVYLYTLCPTVYWDDAGELIAACYTLGVPHPPGHPLYAILGKLFTLIPLGSPAMRVNLMSAFFGSLTCAVMFQVVRELIEQDENIKRFAVYGGIVAAFGAGFSLILWNQSVLAETTTLHAFFMAIVTLLAFRIDSGNPDDDRVTKRLLIFSFIYGLSFTNHVAGLFFMPSLCLILLYRLRLRLFRPGRFIAMILLFFLGFSVYVYLPIASRFNPPVDWGNPENLKNFWWVVSAKQYSGTLARTPDLLTILRGAKNVADTFVSNLTLLGCAFAAVGCVRLWKRRKQVIIYGVLIILILYATSLNSAFIFVYMLPAVLMLSIWAGYGLAAVCERAERAAAGLEEALLARIVGRSAHIAGAVLVAVLFFGHFGDCNMRNYTYPKEYGEELLSSLPQNSVLITGTADPLFICWYLQYCEDFRTDVKVITRNALRRPGYMDKIRRQYPELQIPSQFQLEKDADIRPSHVVDRGKGLLWYANSYFKEFYELNSADFPIFWEGIEANQLLIDRFEPCGLVFRILPPDGEADSTCLEIPSVDSITDKIGIDLATGKIYGNHFFNYGIFYQWRNDTPRAIGYYEDALELYSKDARPLNNIGAMLAADGKIDDAFTKFEEALRLDPDNPTSNHNVGQVLLDRGEAREAIPHFRRAIAVDPGNFEDYYSLGVCYSSVGRNRQAVRMLEKALEIKPTSPETLSSLGVVYLRLQATKNAEKLLKTAIEIEPDNAENWYNLACLQAMEGDKIGATESLEKALTYNYKRVYELGVKDPRISPILESLTESL
jgi:tetratricopeptide (TPR) repeat protein